MKLSNDTLSLFLKEIKNKKLLYEENGKYYLSNKIVTKGKCDFTRGEYTRVFIKTTRFLYKNCKQSQHKHLAYVFQLIPHLHFETNTICKNPEETNDENIEKMSLEEICKFLKVGTSKPNMRKLEKKLLEFYVEVNNKKYYLFKRVIIKGLEENTDFFAVNPCVIWKGSKLDSSRKTLKFLIFNS